MTPLPVPPDIFTHIAIDFLAMKPVDGADEILTVVDRFSLYVVAIPLLKAGTTMKDVGWLLWKHVFSVFGLPLHVLTDNDVLFKGDWWRHWMEALPVRHITTTRYRAQGNGAVENANARILAALRVRLIGVDLNWLQALPMAQWAVNSSPIPHLGGESPNSIVFGRPLMHVDVALRPWRQEALETEAAVWIHQRADQLAAMRVLLREEDREQAEKANARRRDVMYEPGDAVWVETLKAKTTGRSLDSKIAPKWHGPYIVSQFTPPHSVVVYNERSREEWPVHVHRVKPYFAPSLEQLQAGFVPNQVDAPEYAPR
jgi:hypothetical protein